MIEVLADGMWAYRLGQATFALIFPLIGAVLLGIGIRRRRAFNLWNSHDDQRLLQPHPSVDGEGDFDDEFDPRLRDDYDPEYDSDDQDFAPQPGQPRTENAATQPVQPPGKGTVLIAVGAVVLVSGALHVVSTLVGPRAATEAHSVDIGQCITAQAYDQGRMDAEPVDCGRADATLQLVSKGDSTATCPDGSRKGARYPALTNKASTQCFALNLREGTCYVVASTFAPVTSSCTDSAANVKVASRVDGTSESVGCPTGARVLSYVEPARVYCFVAP